MREIIIFDKLPCKRKKRARWASFITFLVVAVGILAYGFARREVEYVPIQLPSDSTLEDIRNEKLRVCTIKERDGLSVLYNTCWGLTGIVVGTLWDRICLLCEESFHCESRYSGKKWKTIKACFKGIFKKGFFTCAAFLVFFLLIIPFFTEISFKTNHVIYMTSGIGIGPLMLRLLNLDTQSEVQISKIMEEKQTNVGETFSWFYYYYYLEKALPKLVFHEDDTFVLDHDPENVVRVDSKKPILLVMLDGKTEHTLKEEIDKITRLGQINGEEYQFSVYRLKHNDTEYTYIIQYVEEALKFLYRMKSSDETNAINKADWTYQVKLFYQTLSTTILKSPPHPLLIDSFVVVPVSDESSIKNGGLIKLILHKINSATPEHEDGFMRIVTIHDTDESSDVIPIIAQMETAV